MTTLDLLRRLQAADDAIESGTARVANIHAALSDRSEYETTRSDYATRTEDRRRTEAEQRHLELELATLRQQLADVETKLYSGTVRDAKELQNLSRESTQIRGLVRSREERVLQAMDDAERAGAAHVESERRLRSIVTERKKTEADLLEERKHLVQTIEQAKAERERLRGEIDAPALKSYDGLRRRLGGQALAGVKQRTCQGCRVGLTAAVEQRLRHGDALVTCQSCGRILYPDS